MYWKITATYWRVHPATQDQTREVRFRTQYCQEHELNALQESFVEEIKGFDDPIGAIDIIVNGPFQTNDEAVQYEPPAKPETD